MVPEGHQRRAAETLDEDLRHADRQRRRAAGARQDASVSPTLAAICVSASGVIAKPQLVIACAAALAASCRSAAAGLFIAK